MNPAAVRPRLAACIITLDEADRIDACIESLAFCDEVIVVDSGSTDGTRERAAARGARVLERAFDGYRTQKDFAVQAAHCDWVLCIDADERVTPALRAAIEAARATGFGTAAAYRFARCTHYFGAPLRHGNAYPDRVLRLFDRRRAGWRGAREIHEQVGVDGPVARLAGDLEHQAYRSLGDQDITSPIASDAASLDAIIHELETTRVPERAGRAMDHESEDAFERLRAAGYM